MQSFPADCVSWPASPTLDAFVYLSSAVVSSHFHQLLVYSYTMLLQTKMLLNVSRNNAIALLHEYRYYCSFYFFMF